MPGHPYSMRKGLALSKGIDVSKWQGAIDWKRVRAAGVEFAIIRSSQGMHYSDPLFEANWVGATANGIHTHPYHYFVAEYSATSETEIEASVMAQVVHFENQLKSIGLPAGTSNYSVFVDVEEGFNESATPDQLYDQIQLFVKLLRKEHPFIGIYTSPHFWANRVNWMKDETMGPPGCCERLSACELWIAHWGVVEPTVPEMWKRAGKGWRWWQYSSKGGVDGINDSVDLNYSWK